MTSVQNKSVTENLKLVMLQVALLDSRTQYQWQFPDDRCQCHMLMHAKLNESSCRLPSASYGDHNACWPRPWGAARQMLLARSSFLTSWPISRGDDRTNNPRSSFLSEGAGQTQTPFSWEETKNQPQVREQAKHRLIRINRLQNQLTIICVDQPTISPLFSFYLSSKSED